MKTLSWIRNRKGFTIIEAVVSIAIFSFVGLAISQVFVRTNQMSINNQETERASALGQMALEQYNAYAAQSYDRLPSKDQTRVTPREFFNAPDDLGYEGLTLSSHAEPSSDGSTTQVTLRVGWGSGMFAPSLAFTKIYPHWMSSEPAKAPAEFGKKEDVGGM